MPAPETVQRELLNMLARFRKEAGRHDISTIGQLMNAYQKIYRRLQDKLELEVRRMFEKPESVVTHAYITRRLESLAEEVQKELQKYQAVIASTIDVSTDEALLMGSKHALELMKLGTLGQKAIRSVNFGILKPEQINTMIAFLAPGSPLFKRIDILAKYHAPKVRDQLIEAIALGYGPNKTAGNIAPLLAEVDKAFKIAMANPFADATRMARTAQLWAYREATRANYQLNSDVVSGWQWYANLDDTTCMSCVAMHGTIHPLDEPLEDHHHGRCTPIPVVLGNAMIAENAGPSWFDELPEQKQQSMMGQGAFEAWSAGRFDLSQLSHQVEDDVYGVIRTVTPLKDLVETVV